jgi:hypothetical protein
MLTEYERKTIVNFFFKRTNLYTWVGRVFAMALLTELAALTLPPELAPDYPQWIIDYGRIPTYVAAFFIGKYFGGQWIVSLVVKFIVLWLCMHYNFKLQNIGKDNITIKNFNFGWGNSNTNTIYNNRKDEENS